MYHELTYDQLKRRRAKRLVTAIIVVCLVVLVAFAANVAQASAREQAAVSVRESVLNAAKQCCAVAYLRGAILGSGFIASPRGDFHFEITVASSELAEGLARIMQDHEIPAKVVRRRNAYVVYLKSGEAICDVLALTGAHQAALRMENERVYKSMRNEVNRKTNAEVANQGKTVDSAVRQVFAIRKVVDEYGMENLPTALQEYIRLRVTYPDASLAELGEHATPALSKSAIAHRVRRIEQMAAEIEARHTPSQGR